MESIRVDATRLSDTRGKTVRVIGQVKSFDASSGSGNIDSNGIVSFTYKSGDALMVGCWYELIAIVQQDLTLNILQSFDFGTEFNANAAIKLVDVVHRLPELFQSEV